jgi:hypothetical protein
VTTVRFEGDRIRSLTYREPAADLVPRKAGPPGA